MKEWEYFLEKLKEESPSIECFISSNRDHVAAAIAAWQMADVKFVEPKEPFPYLYDDRFWWLWNACSFNVIKWSAHLGFNPPHGFLVRMINGRFIYPDGTHNAKVFTLFTQENKDGKK